MERRSEGERGGRGPEHNLFSQRQTTVGMSHARYSVEFWRRSPLLPPKPQNSPEKGGKSRGLGLWGRQLSRLFLIGILSGPPLSHLWNGDLISQRQNKHMENWHGAKKTTKPAMSVEEAMKEVRGAGSCWGSSPDPNHLPSSNEEHCRSGAEN